MKKLVLSLVAIATIITACKKDEETAKTDEETSKTGQVNLTFNQKVGSEDLEFDTIKYTNAFGHDYEVRTLKYFLSNVTFMKSDGSKKVIEGPIYVNAEDASTLNYDGAINLPVGTYSSVSVTFGLDSNLNVTDTLTSVEETAMAWPEMNGGGYHYMKLEGTYDSLGKAAVNKNYAIHTGGIMGNSHDFTVVFENSEFSINENGLNLELTMDINEWFTNPNDYDFSEHGHMIMMNMAAQMELRANGPSVLSISVD